MIPLFASVEDLTKIIGLGRSSIYELLAAGHFTAVKVGKRTLVNVAKAREYIESQPLAEFTSKAA